MKILALDASTEWLCAALVVDAEVIGAQGEPGGAHTSRRLLPLIEELLCRSGLRLADLDALAVAVGPGAFTGLRSVCSTAQGLALGLGLPVLPVDSLEIVAEQAWCGKPEKPSVSRVPSTVLGVAVDARMGQVYDAVYRRLNPGWSMVEAPQVRHPDETAAHWLGLRSGPGHWTGSGVGLMAATAVEQARRAGVHVDGGEADGAAARAQALGRCATQAWSRGERLDAAQLVPRYVRDRVALTTLEREEAARAVMAHG